jgi:hypothetical protein
VKLGLMVVFIVFTASDQAQKNGSPQLLNLIGVPFLMMFCDAVRSPLSFIIELRTQSYNLNDPATDPSPT